MQVLAGILRDWLVSRPTMFTPGRRAAGAAAGSLPIRAKMRLSAELDVAGNARCSGQMNWLHGAPVLHRSTGHRTAVRRCAGRRPPWCRAWIDAGPCMDFASEMDPMPPVLLTIWAATQTYADFDVQVAAVAGTQGTGPQRPCPQRPRHVVSLLPASWLRFAATIGRMLS